MEKAIQASNIGINPQNDGKTLRLIFPPITEERRKEIVKDIAKTAEDAKVAIRSIRRDAIDKYKDMKKKSEITEDDLKKALEKVDKAVEKSIKGIDEVIAAKDKEIMEV
jgi:ribosome recycling factor